MKNGFKQHETSDVSDKKRKTSISLYSVFAGKSKTWKRTVSLLACMVVFFTTYALILPAITLEFEKAESTGMVLENGHELEGSEETLKSGQKEVPEAAGGQAADDFSNEAEDFAALDAVFTADISDNFPAEDFENAESIAVDFPEETEIQSDDLSDTFTCDASSCWAEVHLIDSDGLPKDTDFNFAPLEGEKAARYLAAVQERLGAGYQAEAASFYELSFANDGQLILPDGAFDLSVEYKEENAFHCDGTFFAVLFGKQENSNGNAVVPVESVMLKEKNADGSEIASIRDQRVTAWELKDVRFSEYRGIVGVVSVVEDKPEETDHTDAEIKEETADSEVNFIEEMDKTVAEEDAEETDETTVGEGTEETDETAVGEDTEETRELEAGEDTEESDETDDVSEAEDQINTEEDAESEAENSEEDAETEEENAEEDAEAESENTEEETDVPAELDGPVYEILGGNHILLSEILETVGSEIELPYEFSEISQVTVERENVSADTLPESVISVNYLEESADWEISAETDGQDDISGRVECLTIEYENEETLRIFIRITGTPDVVQNGVTISPVDNSYLPATAQGNAAIIADHTAEETVQDYTAAQKQSAPVGKKRAMALNRSLEAASDPVTDGITKYQVYDISLSGVNTEDYPDGFAVTVDLPETISGRDFHLYHIHDDKTEELELSLTGQAADTSDLQSVSGFRFVTYDFSEFVLQYTVDFHYEINGKTVEFSIPGGGFVSLEHVVEVLGIALTDANAEKDPKQAAKEFVADVADVQFSSPELVSVSKVEEDTTVGAIKEALGLVCEYSAELTEEEIAEIDAQTVEAGDWALISMQPFTSEESLTVTMKNGDQFVVRVTDYQHAASMDEFDGTNQFVIWTELNSHYFALKTDGTTAEINLTDTTADNYIDALGQDFLWTVSYGWNQGNGDYRYYIRPVTDPQATLTLLKGTYGLVGYYNCGIRFYPNSNGSNTWYLEGWGWTRLNLGYNSYNYEPNWDGWYSYVHFTKQEELQQFKFTVKTTDFMEGNVSGKNSTEQDVKKQEQYISITKTDKTNNYKISADPYSAKYLFDYWDLDGKTLFWDALQKKIVFEENSNTTTNFNVVADGSLKIPYNNSVLTAHFKRNPDWVPSSDEEKEGRKIDKESLTAWLKDLENRSIPLNESACDKTAEVYDYENRIYRVDLLAQSSLSLLSGTVDMGFMIDVSSSMKFPSKLTKVKDSLDLYKINNSEENKKWLTKGQTYYIIADKTGTATVCRVFYDYNDEIWKFVDASKEDGEAKKIEEGTKFHSQETETVFPVYQDGDLGKTRSTYLESSLNNTITELQNILKLISVASNKNENNEVKIAWNTFCNSLPNSQDGTKKSFQHEFLPVSNGGISLNYAYAGGTSTDVALLDAAGVNRDDIRDRYDDQDRKEKWKKSEGDYNNKRPTYSDGNNGFEWEQSATKYAILITDGAPQRSSEAVYSKYVEEAAAQLKNKGVTLITVGLSMGDCKRGSVLLYDIASKDENGDPYFYSAETGDELQYVLYGIIQQIMMDAITVGNITDTINEAFYPVDKETGLPLENGNVINLEGVKIGNTVDSLTASQMSSGYGVINKNTSGQYTVTWNSQDISWDGWHGTIYEKAKEDFLGGNAVRTNDPLNPATIVPTSYKLKETDTPIALKNEIVTGKTVKLETPRVNVNELNITENSTEWTVYLGTEVTPAEQLQELFNKIQVEEVVTSANDTNKDGFPDMINGANHYYPVTESASDQRESDAKGTRLTYTMADLLKKLNNGTAITVDSLINAGDNGLTLVYNLYGQDNPGSINIKLTKSGATAEYGKHKTTTTGSPAESYSLTVLFSPEYTHIPAGQGGDGSLNYHTGNFGLGTFGNAAGTEDSTNNHNINVFAKKLKIEKVDQGSQLITSDTATFTLYRKATESESKDTSVGKIKDPNGLPNGDYVIVQTLTTSGGSVITSALALPEKNEPYYLVESKAPAGYYMLTEPLKVTIDMDGHSVWRKLSDNSALQTKPDPYELSNWIQDATIMVTDLSGNASSAAARVISTADNYGVKYDHQNDTIDASVNYRIINSSGYELPSTGGSGTQIFTILGSILTLGAGVVLWRRRKIA